MKEGWDNRTGREERQNVYSIFGLCEPVDGVGGPIIECAPGQRK